MLVGCCLAMAASSLFIAARALLTTGDPTIFAVVLIVGAAFSTTVYFAIPRLLMGPSLVAVGERGIRFQFRGVEVSTAKWVEWSNIAEVAVTTPSRRGRCSVEVCWRDPRPRSLLMVSGLEIVPTLERFAPPGRVNIVRA
jgi:hypothetical protein